MPTLTGRSLHLQTSVPPVKLPEPGFTPLSIDGCIRTVMVLSSLCVTFSASKYNDRPDRLALVHQVDSLVDVLQLEHVGDHRVDLDLPVHVPVDDLRHVGAATCAAERGALPHTAGHELEWAGGNFLSGFRDPNDDGNPPAAVAGLERLAHHRGVAGAVEGEVCAAVGERNQVLNDVAADLGRVDEIRHPKAA